MIFYKKGYVKRNITLYSSFHINKILNHMTPNNYKLIPIGVINFRGEIVLMCHHFQVHFFHSLERWDKREPSCWKKKHPWGLEKLKPPPTSPKIVKTFLSKEKLEKSFGAISLLKMQVGGDESDTDVKDSLRFHARLWLSKWEKLLNVVANVTTS